MRCLGKSAGICALSFGLGVGLCVALPACALICVESSLIIGVGIILFMK